MEKTFDWRLKSHAMSHAWYTNSLWFFPPLPPAHKTFIVSCHVVMFVCFLFVLFFLCFGLCLWSERDFDDETDRKQHEKRVSPGWLCYWFSLDAIHARSPHVGFTSSRETRCDLFMLDHYARHHLPCVYVCVCVALCVVHPWSDG